MKAGILFGMLFIAGGLFAQVGQGHWSWRRADGTMALAPQDFPYTGPPGTVRLRIAVYNFPDHREAGFVRLQYRCGRTGEWVTVSDNMKGRDMVMAGKSPFVTDTLQAGRKKEYEWRIKPTPSLRTDSVYQFRVALTGGHERMGYHLPLPEIMYRSKVHLTGNSGIYRDPLVTGFFTRDSGWVASDGCISIPLSDGRVLWTMGDSYINHYDRLAGTTGCLFQVRNCALLQPLNGWGPAATSTLIGRGPGIPSLFKNDTNNHQLLWPAGGYQYGDTVYVYNSSQRDTSGGLGFTRGSNDVLAKMLMPGLQVVGYDALPSFGTVSFGLGFDADEPGDYVYTWGIQPAYISCRVVVARFPRDNPRAPWTFWNGKGWDTAVAHIAGIATGASNGSYVAKVRNKYVLVSTEFSVSCDAGTRIYAATSDHVTGPFTDIKLLYTIPDNVLGHTPFFYGPAVHPEYINSKNELLITYDINGYSNCEPNCIENGFNPDYYRPRGLRVPLSLIDTGIRQ